ncbi:hypothetical protein F4821DRAFT_251905, partial [Hypoxylon rubiginosum]
MALTTHAYSCYGTLYSSSVALTPWKFQGLCDPPPLFGILGLSSLLAIILYLCWFLVTGLTSFHNHCI